MRIFKCYYRKWFIPPHDIVYSQHYSNEYNNRKQNRNIPRKSKPQAMKARQKPLNTACGFLRMVGTPMTSRRSFSLTSYFRLHTPWGRVVNCTLSKQRAVLWNMSFKVIMTQEQWWCHQTNPKNRCVFFFNYSFPMKINGSKRQTEHFMFQSPKYSTFYGSTGADTFTDELIP